MAIRPESRWWIVALLLLGLLFGLSALALDKPDVVWAAGVPQCPHCRNDVRPFSGRCSVCREEFDWAVAPDLDSPISPWSLSPLEEELLRARVKALGEAVAVARVAERLQLPPEAAAEYLRQVGTGRCGWCGGAGTDLAQRPPAPAALCPCCFGGRQSVACGGDRRIRVGDEGAARDLVRYRQAVVAIGDALPLEAQRTEVSRLGQQFVLLHAGTQEAASIWFAPEWTPRGGAPDERTPCVLAARRRLNLVLDALAAP